MTGKWPLSRCVAFASFLYSFVLAAIWGEEATMLLFALLLTAVGLFSWGVYLVRTSPKRDPFWYCDRCRAEGEECVDCRH
jgi:hypothetical protein